MSLENIEGYKNSYRQAILEKPSSVILSDYLKGFTLWRYLVLNPSANPQLIKPADAVIALGNSRLEIPRFAADLMLAGKASVLVCSGNRGAATKDWLDTEAQTYANIAREKGYKGEILIEADSFNTGDNVRFSKEILEVNDYYPKRLIIVALPMVQKRIKAITDKHLPNIEVEVVSPPIAFSFGRLVSVCMGEVNRLVEYPAKGFQAPVEIPERIFRAKQSLEVRYNGRLMAI